MRRELERKARIERIRSLIERFGEKGVMKDKIVGVFGCETGMARRYILEYLNMLIAANKITDEKGLLRAK